MSLAGYLPVLILAVLATLTVFGALTLQNRLRPRAPSAEKLSPYECGETPIGSSRVPMDIQYYLYVLLFLVMDVEIIFLVPWALQFERLGARGLIEIVIFVGLLLVAWGYAWRRGALRWLR